MKFFIDDLPICFPYDRIYPEQYSYMCDLKRTLDATGHCVLEMPSGTGKTVSLLSLIVSYQQFYPTKRKLIYCSRTVPEIEKALSELKRLMAYRIAHAETPEQVAKERAFTGLGLTSRKNLCLHPEVSKEKKGKVVDARCRDLTSAAACERGRADPENNPLCAWHEGLNDMEEGALVPPGIHTLADISNLGRERTTCPYFTIRRMMPFVDVVIYSFHYLLDPKVAEQVSKELSKDSIVVFDEAHNIDNVCIESLSIDLTRPMLDAAARSVVKLGDKIEEIKATDATRLQEEYEKLVEGLQEADEARAEDAFMANPVLPDDLLKEAVPETYPMTLTRNCFLPLVITRGSDQVAVSSRFEVRNDPSVVRNFGSILIEYCKIVPDGVVAFFPSYLYMESIVAAWHDMGILSEVWKNKLIFVETPDANETSVALENYRKACDNGRGAVLLSVARGKVSEGIDFDHNYGRAVIMFGIPYQYTESRILKARLEYLRDAYRIRESEFLGFDAMRNAAQCVGRVLRGKTDWGLMIFADK
ncbi:hypothetical protein FS749_008201, partial [Ceratobasidium sp. UAMH 11750]